MQAAQQGMQGSAADAQAMYAALAQPSADIGVARGIIQKRANDLDVLYKEYNSYLTAMLTQPDIDAVTKAKSNVDLITWLRQKGLNKDSEAVMNAIQGKLGRYSPV
jgi:pyruvate/oxaloacetate carboxyltransferase